MIFDELNTMPPEKREEFRKFLLGLKGDNIEVESEALLQQIKYPPYLYRYRPTDINALDCLANNKLYFSCAKYYDDPFDTYLYIDYERVLSELKALICNKQWQEVEIPLIAEVFGLSIEQLKEIFAEKNLDAFKQLTNRNLHVLCNMVQAEMYSVCFSDDPTNEVLWLKYAQNHRGFVMMYDLHDSDAWFCGKSENCATREISSAKSPTYPVCYTDEPYDATLFARAVATIKNLQITGAPQEKIVLAQRVLGEHWWEREKVSLIKHKCHEYDREWRMISPYYGDKQFIKWRPCGVIMGLRTTDADKRMIITAAEKAGIPKIYQSYITKKNELDAFQI